MKTKEKTALTSYYSLLSIAYLSSVSFIWLETDYFRGAINLNTIINKKFIRGANYHTSLTVCMSWTFVTTTPLDKPNR